jgi:hypothetical protein
MNTTANQWQIQIQGWASDLEHLARHFTTLPMRVTEDEREGGFLYESSAFASCTTSQEVLDVADREFAVLSGVLKLVRESHEPLRSGAVYRRNAAGGRDVFVHIRETLQLRVELGDVTVTVTDSQGNVVTKPSPPPRIILLAQLAASDAAVAKAFRLHADEGSKSWVGLYRIYEVVEADVGGQAALAKRSWGSASDLKRFKHSANSVTVAGDTARHGKEIEKPPKHPMSLDEAAAFVGYVLQAWLASKGA